jgi:hypothetical protein
VSNKKPHLRETPLAAKKEPRTAIDPDAYRRQYPSWRVRFLEFVEPFGWHEANEEELRAIHGRLSNFESMTWEDILIRANHHNHHIRVDQICTEARGRLAAIGRGDVETVVSLRVSAKERVWGILEGAVLHVLWWDPEHLVYPLNGRG